MMIEQAINRHRILIVGGSGGVGKTSVSAAVGIAAARAGYRTLVLTIDPARRLAAALGLEGIGPEAENISDRLRSAGIPIEGELHAMMLDVQNTLDRAVERYAPNEQRRQEILANRLYQNLSTRLSGSQEYAAMQRLCEIASGDQYDRIILDTPPSTQALDFLTAPERLQAFFDSRLIKVFLGFGSSAGRGFFRVSDVLFRTLERLTGAHVIRDIGEFFQVAESILEPFGKQAERAQALLRDERTTFLIVTGPQRMQLEDAAQFRARVGELGIGVSALVVNRWRPPLVTERVTASDQSQGEDLAGRIEAWTLRLEALAQAQTDAIAEVEESIGVELIRLKELDSEIDSLRGLAQLTEQLSAGA